MPTRTAHARREGSVKTGNGEIDFGNGLFRSDYSFGSRCETDVTLTSTLGQPISLSEYRGRSNLVLVFAGGGDNSPDLKISTEIGADYPRFLDEQTLVLTIVQCTQAQAARIKEQANLPFPLLVDEDGRIHRSAGAADNYGHSSGAIYITDRFGEVFAAYRAVDGQAMPDVHEIVTWVAFINSQCRECSPPEWPA